MISNVSMGQHLFLSVAEENMMDHISLKIHNSTFRDMSLLLLRAIQTPKFRLTITNCVFKNLYSRGFSLSDYAMVFDAVKEDILIHNNTCDNMNQTFIKFSNGKIL